MKKILFIVLIINSMAFAQQTVKFSAQFRPRFEIDNKDFNSSNQSTTFTLLRTRLGAMFSGVGRSPIFKPEHHAPYLRYRHRW